MRSLFPVLLAVTILAPQKAAAQSGTAVGSAVADSISAAVTAPVKKKKGGMFGKIKGLAKNKIVNTVAKAALCTVVPGGQVVAGALDAAKTKNAAGAAGAASAALSGGGGGGSCMPGLAGMAAPKGAGAGIGAAGVGALGSVGASAAALPGQPSTGMGMAMSPEQLKKMQEQYGKMGMDTAQLRAMQQQMMGGASEGAAVAPSGPAPVASGPALTREKGKMLLRRLPWVPGSEGLQQGSEPVFGMVMQGVVVAIKATPKHYKIEARVEEQGGKAENKLLAKKRGAAVLAALVARGVSADVLTVSEGKADKDPRIIVSEGK
jgi:hypothetical protein